MNLYSVQKLCYSNEKVVFKCSTNYFLRNLSLWVLLFFIFYFSFLLSVNAQTNSNQIYYKQGFDNIYQQDFAAAVRSFQQALKISPEDDNSRRGLAIALVGVEKFAEASREIAKLLAHSPKDSDLLELSAKTFWQQKRFVEAEAVIKRRLELENVKAENWAIYGDILDAQRKTIEAIKAYKSAVNMLPDSVDYRYALGALYWKIIRFDEAEREFLEILKIKPEEPRASFNLGDIYLSRDEAQKAIPFLKTAAESFQEEYDVHFALGRAFLKNGNFDKAIEELQLAIKLRPEIAEGYYQLGIALQKLGRRNEAKAAFEKVKELQKSKLESEKLPKNQ
ncbi:MAG: tetratricopeptide repeat protein [Aridibacter sp.]